VLRVLLSARAGDSFKVDDPTFGVYSWHDAELESVLPTPFPVLVPRFVTDLTAAQIDHLCDVQNALHLPSRFALLISLVTQPDADRRLLRP